MSSITSSARQTQQLAARLAETLRPGACIALSGELGAGKTQFVRGLVEGLGGEGRSVSSPTFVLLNAYDTPRIKVYHMDAYRVGADDFEAIGFPELLEQGGVVVVEWPERVTALLPAARIDVRIEILSPRRRRVGVSAAEGCGQILWRPPAVHAERASGNAKHLDDRDSSVRRRLPQNDT